MHGLAQQPDRLNTIEEHLFTALRRAKLVPPNEDGSKFGLHSDVNYQRCGRTDVGVSAFSQVVSLKVRSLKPKTTETPDNSSIDLQAYIHKLNSLLPPEIKVYAAAAVPENFSARFSCTERQYKYFFMQENLNLEMMRKACALLVGSHDFRNFCKIDAANVMSFIREIRAVEIECIQEAKDPKHNLLAFVLKGSGFLWHQVRCIVAVLFTIGEGLEEVSVVSELLDVKKNPCKPTYKMAPELPLVLWDCAFGDDKPFVHDEGVIARVHGDLLAQYKELVIKTGIMGHMLGSLENTAEISRPVQNTRSKKRKYKALLERPVGPSLEELISNLSTKRKELYNAKKRKLNEYNESQTKEESAE